MFGDRLKEYRLKNRYSQRDLADKLYVSRQCVSKWERNVTQPDLEMLDRICEALHVSVGELLSPPEEKTQKPELHAILLIGNCLAALFCALAVVCLWRFLPQSIPAHWTHGVLDRVGSRNEIFLHLLSIFVFFALDVALTVFLRRSAEKRVLCPVHVVVLCIQAGYLIFLLVLYCKYVSDAGSFATGLNADLLFCVSIAMHPKWNKPNRFFGVRTSDTLSSPEIWRKTNALACYLCAGCSALIFSLLLILRLRFPYLLLLAYLVPVAETLVYSRRISR